MIKDFFKSSHNPEEVSLTIKSATQAIIAVVVAFCALKGVDASPLVTNIKAIAEQIIIIVTTGVATWHSCLAIYGYVRKFFVVTPPATTSTNG